MKLHASILSALLALYLCSVASAATTAAAADNVELSNEGAAARGRALLTASHHGDDDDYSHGGRCKVLSLCDWGLLVRSALPNALATAAHHHFAHAV